MKKMLVLIGVLLVLVAVLAACGGNATEAPVVEQPTEAPVVATEAPVVELTGDPIRGGLLYDEWFKVLGVDTPEGDQALWATQTTNTRSGGTTWRCKECHGWDYLGKDGAYGSGSHATGFVGVMQVAGIDPNEILAMLKGSTNPDHDFSAYMDDQALTDIALFLSENMLDSAAFITDKAAVGGDAANGEAIYGENCTECHGPEGLVFNFADESGPEYYGTIATDNPWEFVHKARFGQPGVADMPALVDLGLADQDYIDLLTFAQTLPTSSPVAEGGRLYDNWIAATGAADMIENQPLWATQTTNERTGNDTWRCKECHGWDYKGVDGRYGSGSHMTGFPGILASKDKPAEELLAALKGENHDFSSYMNDDQLNALVAFMQQVEDMAPYINDDKTVNGDPENGKTLFEGTCQMCHGEDGKALDFDDGDGVEFVGTVAADNPWEVLNKLQNGQPGAVMAAGRNMDWTLQDLLDILSYIQTLPIE
ncbi:MAG: c-type cytochrome [Chloroflexi bacterium]|nr:c-type cytochrome [Chloroflexota bacterium]